jgi:hypothetical protein
MRSGVPFTGPPALGLEYKKFADWLQSPPNFPAISLNEEHQRSTGPMINALGARIVLSDAQEVNASRDMRLYIDDCDPTNAVLKISPHVNYPPSSLPHPPTHPTTCMPLNLFYSQIFFEIHAKDSHRDQCGHPKILCDSIDRLSGCMGLTYHLRFPPDYPTQAPLVRMLTPHVSGGVFLPQSWKARTSFEAAFRAVIMLHCDDQPMAADSAATYKSEKEAAKDASGVARPAPADSGLSCGTDDEVIDTLDDSEPALHERLEKFLAKIIKARMASPERLIANWFVSCSFRAFAAYFAFAFYEPVQFRLIYPYLIFKTGGRKNAG